MISKNSFWVSLKENNKRRIWLWILSAFTYLVVLPTVTAMFISSYKTNNSYLIEQYGESAGMARIRQETMNQLLQIFNGDNLLLLVIISGVAIVSGIQGFSYLYHKNKIDFYQAAPVKQSRRFLTIWLNGVLVYLDVYKRQYLGYVKIREQLYCSEMVYTGGNGIMGTGICFDIYIYSSNSIWDKN